MWRGRGTEYYSVRPSVSIRFAVWHRTSACLLTGSHDLLTSVNSEQEGQDDTKNVILRRYCFLASSEVLHSTCGTDVLLISDCRDMPGVWKHREHSESCQCSWCQCAVNRTSGIYKYNVACFAVCSSPCLPVVAAFELPLEVWSWGFSLTWSQISHFWLKFDAVISQKYCVSYSTQQDGKASCTQAVHTNLNPPCLSLHYQLQCHYHQCYVGISWLLAFSLDLWIFKRDQPEDFQLHFGSCGLKLIIIIIIIIRGFQVPVFQELDVNMYQVL